MSQRTVHQSDLRDVLQTLIATRTQFSVHWQNDQIAVVAWQGPDAYTDRAPVKHRWSPQMPPEGPAAA